MICKTSDQLDLYYELHGNPEASDTLVLLNGLTQSTLAWFFFLPYFKFNYKIVLLDFIFQGQSAKNSQWRDFDQHAADVKEVMNQERISKVTLIGISYGSMVAQNFAVLFPGNLNKLVLISTFAHKTPYYEAIEQSWWRALESGGYALMLDIMLPSVLSENYFSDPLIPISVMKESRKGLNQNNEAIFSLMRATKERQDYRNELEKINAPTLIIQGEKDLLLPVHLAKAVQSHIRNSNLVVVPNAGHTLNLEHIQEVCAEILKFLQQIK